MSGKVKRETTNSYPIAREGIIFIVLGSMITAVIYYYLKWWAGIPLVLTIFMTWFFRNPRRYIPDYEGMVVAPADGRIIRVEEVADCKYIEGLTKRVTIFMSIFNVHVNRMPIRGQVINVQHKGGEYLPAYRPDAPEKNVVCYTLINSQWGQVLIAQITGAIARRLVCYAHPGRVYQTGQLFGLIKFGSCVQLYLPPEVALMVKEGDKVRGGETEIGRFDQ